MKSSKAVRLNLGYIENRKSQFKLTSILYQLERVLPASLCSNHLDYEQRLTPTYAKMNSHIHTNTFIGIGWIDKKESKVATMYD